MNKKIIILTLIVSFSSFAQSEKKSIIDNLKTEDEVENFIIPFYGDFYLSSIQEDFSIIQGVDREFAKKFEYCKNIADSLSVTKSFYKADFDQNGLTDILVIGSDMDINVFVVLDFGKDGFKFYSLTRKIFQDCVVPEISNTGSNTVINYYYKNNAHWTDKGKISKILKKTLIYKFGDFVEYNRESTKYHIEKIDFQTTSCFGTCPEFKIIITNNKKGFLSAKSYNKKSKKGKEIKGEFIATIKKKNYNNIVELLNYIDFPRLKDNYDVNWTDDQSCTLTITYNNGKVKEIKDYGLIGTFGLNRVYDLLFKLRFNQEWKKIKESNK